MKHPQSSITIRCREHQCVNTLVIAADSPQPKDWLCPTCEDHIDELQRGAWIERMAALMHTALTPTTRTRTPSTFTRLTRS